MNNNDKLNNDVIINNITYIACNKLSYILLYCIPESITFLLSDVHVTSERTSKQQHNNP